METFKRILAVVVITLAVIGIVLCLVGIVTSWSMNTPITESLTDIMIGLEQFLTVSHEVLGEINSGLGEAQTAVDTIETATVDVGTAIAETDIVYELLAVTVGDTLFPIIESAKDTAVAILGTIVSINDALESLNEIPLVEVPTLTKDLQELETNLIEISNEVTQMRVELQAAKEDAISVPVETITGHTTAISTGLTEAQTDITDTRGRIEKNLQTLATIKAGIPGLIDLISLMSTIILLWLTFAQSCLILNSWSVLKGKDPLETIKETGD